MVMAPTADRITLTGLRVRGRHGVFPAERELGQEFVIDASVWLDTRPAAAGDALEHSVHYGDLALRLAAIVSGEPVLLIETLADRLVAACLREEIVTRAEVTVHKPAAPIPLPFADVSITVARDRPSPGPGPGPGPSPGPGPGGRE
jgi:dihydroneopterin aldolase